MMSRVHTIFFMRNPYLFSDMTWGPMYLLHGLAGVRFIALVTIHVYLAVRMVGSMRPEFYLEHYDPKRWPLELPRPESSRPDRQVS